MEKLHDDVSKYLKVCLGSTSGMLDLRQLQREYKMLMGEDIPYRKLGYNKLEDFILTLPMLNTTRGRNGELLVYPKPTENATHIMSMIKKQKTKKKKLPQPPRFNFNRNNPIEKQSLWRPKGILVKNNTTTYQKQRTHNQFVNYPTSPPKTSAHHQVNKKQQQQHTLHNTNNDYYREPQQQEEEKCSVLMKTKLRLTKKMNNIKLENSITTTNDDSTSNNIQKKSFTPTGNDIEDLKQFTNLHGLPEPVYKIVQRQSKKSRITIYDCQIKVENDSYSTYPTDFHNEDLAKTFVAKKALENLIKKYGRRRSLLVSNEKDILERIPPIVEKHYNGIWNSQLEADYTDKFQEQLPTNWLQILTASPCISIVHSMNNMYIVQYCKPGDILQKGNMNVTPLTSNLSIPCNTVTVTEDNTIIGVITCAASACEVWCRQLQTPEVEAFDTMNKKLEYYYEVERKGVQARDIKIGGYYVAKCDESWVRVRVLSINNKDVINCFFVDFGDECEVNSTQVYELLREFAIEQAQAFVCRLSGLEELYEVSANCECLQQLLNKIVFIDSIVDDNPKDETDDVSTFNVYMYDMENNSSLNQLLIGQICAEIATPKLQKDTINEVYASNIVDTGDIYIQVNYLGLNKLQSLLNDLEKAFTEKPPNLPNTQLTKQNSKNRLYYAKCMDDENWNRVKIIDWEPNGLYAQIYYVDSGKTKIIKLALETLYPLDEMNDVVSQFPEQAVKVRMSLDKPLTQFKKHVSALMPENQKLLLKIINFDGDLAFVEFFKRSESDNVLFSINKAIMLENELRIQNNQNGLNREQNTNPTKHTKLQRLVSLTKTIPSAGLLKSPPLPPEGDYFDVKIPFAVNPWNFCVQPYQTNDKLTKLMVSLQDRYKDSNFHPLSVDDIKPGRIYASKHNDGTWYRTSVIKVITVDSISVFYCDFGYYDNLKLHQLVPLDPEFAELPYQAIKAKLAGIKPVKQKWTMDDCKYFQDLVLKKLFVSILVSIEKDELYQCDTILNLKLVDTSTPKDIYIDNVLVEKGIAVFDASK